MFFTQRLFDNVGVFIDDLSGFCLRAAAAVRVLRTKAVSFYSVGYFAAG